MVEEQKFKELKQHMSHKVLRDIRTVNYASAGALNSKGTL